jgi:hypothetical protein
LGLVIWACRPRKEWPAFFSLSINEFHAGQFGNQRANGESMVAPPPALNCFITSKLLFEEQDGDKIGSDEEELTDETAVLFINPTKYSLEEDAFSLNPSGERSAFDPDVIEEESSPLVEDI